METDTGKIIIFIFIFIGTFIALVGVIPTQFVEASGQTPKTYMNQETLPDRWRGMDLRAYNFSAGWNDTLTTTYSAQFQEAELGNRKYEVLASYVPYINDYIRINHLYGFMYWQHESAKWYNQENELVSFESGVLTIENNINGEILDDTYEEYERLEYKITFAVEYHYLIVLFDYNITSYNSPSEAWHSNDLWIFVGVTIDQVKTTTDTLNILLSLITMQTLEVFGTNEWWAVLLNGIIVGAISISIAVCIFMVIMEILPF